MLLKCINKIKGVYGRILRPLRIFFIKRIPGVKMGSHLQLLGAPIIEICDKGRLHIGDDCVLRSVNASYHANLYAPVKLKVSVPNAEICIGNGTKVYGSSINAFKRISIGNKCLIAANCHFFDANGHLLCFDNLDNRMRLRDEGREIIIEDYVWIGVGCIILPGVHIGRGSVIGAGSVVTKDIPPMCVAAGNPAKVIRYYKEKEI